MSNLKSRLGKRTLKTNTTFASRIHPQNNRLAFPHGSQQVNLRNILNPLPDHTAKPVFEEESWTIQFGLCRGELIKHAHFVSRVYRSLVGKPKDLVLRRYICLSYLLTVEENVEMTLGFNILNQENRVFKQFYYTILLSFWCLSFGMLKGNITYR